MHSVWLACRWAAEKRQLAVLDQSSACSEEKGELAAGTKEKVAIGDCEGGGSIVGSW